MILDSQGLLEMYYLNNSIVVNWALMHVMEMMPKIPSDAGISTGQESIKEMAMRKDMVFH